MLALVAVIAAISSSPLCTFALPTSSFSPSAESISIQKRSDPITIPLRKRASLNGGPGARRDWFKKQGRRIEGKYGKKSTTEVVKRAEAGTVDMTNYLDSIWFGDVSIGTPSRSFGLILDTGSSDLIVATPNCIGCPADTPGFSFEDSSTAKNLSGSKPFSIQYGSGAASGYLVEDTVEIGGFTSLNQTFALCSEMDNINNGTISGILGMGWPAIASSGSTPLVHSIAAAGQLPQQVFGFSFESHTFLVDGPVTKSGGSLMIGGVDTTKYSGEIDWNELTEEGYWEIPLRSVTVNGEDLGITTENAIIDTGTTLIGMPRTDVERIYASIPNSAPVTLDDVGGYYSFPCDQNVEVALTFGNMTYTLPTSAFNGGTYDQDENTCLGAIYALQNDRYIIGDAFLTTVYSAFRLSDPPAVGFALLGSNGQNPQDPSLSGPISIKSSDATSLLSPTTTSKTMSFTFVISSIIYALVM